MDTTPYKQNILFSPGSEAVGDVILLPTDTAGTPGLLNTEVLRNLGLPLSIIPRDVSDYSIVKRGRHSFCFVVTVGNDDTAALLKSNLAAALSDKRILRAKSLWIPLMGTGTGQLSFRESYEIIEGVLQFTGWLTKKDARVFIAPPASQRPEDIVGVSSLERSANSVKQESVPELRLTAAVEAALEFAADLRSGTNQRGGQVSTTLLFFALAESQNEAAPDALRKDHATLLFSGAVYALAGKQRFREAWEAYFSPSFVLPASLPRSRAFQQTPNVQEVLRRAGQRSQTRPVEIDDLVRSLLAYPQGRHRSIVEAMGVSMTELLREYNDALTGQIGKKLVNDVAAETDQLGYDRYANAITDFLIDAETPPPLSISIQAPWGAGKSSLMHQIRNRLDPKEIREAHKATQSVLSPGGNRLKLGDVLSFLDRRRSNDISKPADPTELWTVWFNAWKYDTSEQMWAGLVDAIVSQVSNRLKPVDRELFLLRLQLARIDDGIVRRKIYDRIVTIWWVNVRAWLIAGGAAIASFFGLGKVAATTSLDPTLISLLEWSPLVPTVVLAAYLTNEYFKSRKKTQNEPASFSLAEYLTVPNYHQTLGSVHHTHEDLLRVLSLTPIQATTGLPSPIVVFIDDLDRCSPSKVASVVEGVSMFLASDDYRCMFVIGMDPQMIAAALEEAHAKVRIQLPRYERTVPLGWRFMDKFIQLPFTIPPTSGGALEKYVNWLGEIDSPEHATGGAPEKKERTSENPQSHQSTSHSSGSEQQAVIEGQDQASGTSSENNSEAEREFKESRDVGSIIRRAALGTPGNPGNPREIKRIANLARLYLGLRNNRRTSENSWRSPSLDQYARWITVTLRWPDMMRWLQWGADEGTWTKTQSSFALTERRLQFLQDRAHAAKKADDWTKALEKTLKVPVSKESDWACDHKLYEFFKTEANLEPHETLSDAAGRGFW